MSSEFKNIIKNIDKELAILKEEKANLIEKINKGENFTAEDNKRNKEIAKLIKELETKKKNLESYEDLANVDYYLNILADTSSRYSKEDKLRICQKLLSCIDIYNKGLLNDLKVEINDEDDRIKDYNDIAELRRELEIKKSVLNELNTKNRKIKKSIELNSNKLYAIKAFLDNYILEDDLYKDLEKLVDKKTTKEEKEEIINFYSDLMNDYINNDLSYDNNSDDYDDDLDDTDSIDIIDDDNDYEDKDYVEPWKIALGICLFIIRGIIC